MVPVNCGELFGKEGATEAVICESSVTTRSTGSDLQNLDLELELNLYVDVSTSFYSLYQIYMSEFSQQVMMSLLSRCSFESRYGCSVGTST